MKTITTLFLLIFYIGYAHADSKTDSTEENLREYDIEVIIFEDAHARYINSEMWHQNIPENSTSLLTSNNVKKSGSTRTNMALFKNITPAILKSEYKRIKNSSEYSVLFYGAWRQTGLEESKAFEINISDLNNAHNSKSKNSITGQLKVVLARYLHFYSQLEYQRQDVSTEELNTQNVNQSDILTTGNNIYPLKSHRRMRSKELHYIDHPLVGMLVQINPVKKPEKEEPVSQ